MEIEVNWTDIDFNWSRARDHRKMTVDECIDCFQDTFLVSAWFDGDKMVGYDSKVMRCMFCGSVYGVPNEAGKNRDEVLSNAFDHMPEDEIDFLSEAFAQYDKERR